MKLSLFSAFSIKTKFASCCSEDAHRLSEIKNQDKQNRFVSLSEGVTACAVHPLNSTIIAGTKVCAVNRKPSLLFIFQILNFY